MEVMLIDLMEIMLISFQLIVTLFFKMKMMLMVPLLKGQERETMLQMFLQVVVSLKQQRTKFQVLVMLHLLIDLMEVMLISCQLIMTVLFKMEIMVVVSLLKEGGREIMSQILLQAVVSLERQLAKLQVLGCYILQQYLTESKRASQTSEEAATS